MSELVTRLTVGDHPVVVGGSQPTLEDLHRRVTDICYVFVRFVDTRGGTELGFPIDRTATHTDSADFDKGTGVVHIEGNLELDYVPVRVVADLDLATLSGTGHLDCPGLSGGMRRDKPA